eukprot:SAG31_NODE_2966_length_4842_cov_23.744676_3_plen_427_part_01
MVHSGAAVQWGLNSALAARASRYTLPAGDILFDGSVFRVDLAPGAPPPTPVLLLPCLWPLSFPVFSLKLTAGYVCATVFGGTPAGFVLSGAPSSSTTLWFAPGGGMVIANSTGITIKNLTIDYGRTGRDSDTAPVAQFAIRSIISSASSCCPKVGDQGFDPCAANDPTSCCMAEYELELHPRSHPVGGFNSSITRGFPGLRDCSRTRSQVWNDGELVNPPEGWLHTQCHASRPPAGYTPLPGTMRGPGGGKLYRSLQMPINGARVGTRITFYGRSYLTYVVANSTRVVTEDVTIHGATGFAIQELDGQCGHVYRRVRIARRSGTDPLMIASNADGFHSNSCGLGALLDQCELSFMMDDYINVHGQLFELMSSDTTAKTLRLQTARPNFVMKHGGCEDGWGAELLDLYDSAANPMSNVRKDDSLSCYK